MQLVDASNCFQLWSQWWTGVRNEVIKVEGQYFEGAITNGERYNKIIAIWSDVTEQSSPQVLVPPEQSSRSADRVSTPSPSKTR